MPTVVCGWVVVRDWGNLAMYVMVRRDVLRAIVGRINVAGWRDS